MNRAVAASELTLRPVIFLSLVLVVSRGFACTCRPDANLQDHYSNASYVVVGILEGAELAGGGNLVEVQLKLESVLKAPLGESAPARFHTDQDGGSCGLPVRPGDRYVIYANTDRHFTFCDGSAAESYHPLFRFEDTLACAQYFAGQGSAAPDSGHDTERCFTARPDRLEKSVWTHELIPRK